MDCPEQANPRHRRISGYQRLRAVGGEWKMTPTNNKDNEYQWDQKQKKRARLKKPKAGSFNWFLKTDKSQASQRNLLTWMCFCRNLENAGNRKAIYEP